MPKMSSAAGVQTAWSPCLLIQGVVDPERGTAVQITSCNYFVKEPATAYQPWVEALLKQYRAFNDFVKVSGLPADVQQKVGVHCPLQPLTLF